MARAFTPKRRGSHLPLDYDAHHRVAGRDREGGIVAKTEVNVSAVIDAGSLNRYQIGVFFLCGLFLIMDGFDVQSMGYVAPAIITEWKIPRETLTPVLMAGL